MSKFYRFGFIIIALSFIIVNWAMADDQDRKQDRKRDGSCQTDLVSSDNVKVLAADQNRDRTRDQKKDGSCQTELKFSGKVKVLAADQDSGQFLMKTDA